MRWILKKLLSLVSLVFIAFLAFVILCIVVAKAPEPQTTSSKPYEPTKRYVKETETKKDDSLNQLSERRDSSVRNASKNKEPEIENTVKHFFVRIGFFNDTEEKPISRNCRIWIRGFGDFYPARKNEWKSGGTLIDKVGPFDTKNEHVIYFYPDYSDESREIKVPFKFSEGMNPEGSVRDMITIEIKPDKICFMGIPIRNANGHYNCEFDRKTCKMISQ